MTANVSVEVAKKDDVLMLPPAALRFKPKLKVDNTKEKDTANSDGVSGQRPAGGGRPNGAGKGGSSKTGERSQKVYLLKEGKPLAVQVKTGIANNSSIELVEGDIKDGDEVIVEQIGGDTKKKAGASSSPMGHRF
jgi:HlyD family secretion protein